MPEVLAATGEYLAQLASLNDNDLQVDADLLKDFDIGAKVAKQEITGKKFQVIHPRLLTIISGSPRGRD